MRYRYVLAALVFTSMTSFSQQEVRPPISIASPHLAVTSNSIFLMASSSLGGIEIMKWTNGKVAAKPFLKENTNEIRYGIGIGTSYYGDLYVACTRVSKERNSPHSYEIYAIDFEAKSSRLVLQLDNLMPIKFLVSTQGYIYVLGLLDTDTDKINKGIAVSFLHMVDDKCKIVKSQLPVPVRRREDAFSLMTTATMSMKANGNFVITLDPGLLLALDLYNIASNKIAEYTPQGGVFAEHIFVAIPKNSVVQSAIFDIHENLIAQFGVWQKGKSLQAGLWQFPAVKYVNGTYLRQLNDVSSTEIIGNINSAETLVGTLEDGTIISVSPRQGGRLLKFIRFF